jgi:hypothetical protein
MKSVVQYGNTPREHVLILSVDDGMKESFTVMLYVDLMLGSIYNSLLNLFGAMNGIRLNNSHFFCCWWGRTKSLGTAATSGLL